MGTISPAFERIKERARLVQDNVEAALAVTPRQLFLPGFDIGAMPNHLNRSSLIAPIGRGYRKFHHQTVMVTRKDCVLEYTGEQLDESDGDLIMALIFFAQQQPFGTPILLKQKKLLRQIKHGGLGSSQYKWLHQSLKRLRAATLFIEAKNYRIGKMTSFNILKELSYDDLSQCYRYVLDPRWVTMFGNKEYALLNWEKRMQIGRGIDMAKTLQRLIATNRDSVQRYGLENLKAQMDYASPMRKFRESLNAACRELERLEIIYKGSIEESTKGNQQLVLMRAAKD